MQVYCKLFCAVVLLSALAPCSGWAQEDPESDPSSETQADMVVTAQKREEKQSEVPLSLTVIDGASLAQSGASSVTEVAQRVPNLFYAGFSAKRTSTPFIRGLGSGQGEPAVTTFLDGVPQLTLSSGNLELLDLKRIEVLRGPQGTLYGRNTLGGLINLITADPGDRFHANLEAELGDYSHRRLRAAVSGPLVEGKLYYQVGAAAFERDGFVTNSFTDQDLDSQDTRYARVSLLYTPNAQWRVRLSAHDQSDEDGGYKLASREEYAFFPGQVAHDALDRADRDVNGSSATATYTGKGFKLTSITAFDKNDVGEDADLDFTPQNILKRKTDEIHKQFYQELRINSDGTDLYTFLAGLPMDWTAGVSYYKSKFDHLATTNLNLGEGGSFGEDYALRDDGLGIFASSTLHINQLDLTLGLRYENDNKRWDLDMSNLIFGFDLHMIGEDQKRFSELLPQFALAYDVAPRTMAFFKVAKSYRAGGYNRNTGVGFGAYSTQLYRYDPETSWSYEVGLKTSLWQDRIYLATNVFYLDWRDRQLSVPLAEIPGQYYLDNVGDSTSRGIEFELGAKLSALFDLTAALGTQDASYGHYIDPESGQDLEGKHLPLVPDKNWSLGLNYHQDLGAVDVFANLYANGFGALYYDGANTVGEQAVELINARAGLAWSGLRLEAWAKNLGDKTYYHIAIPHTIAPGSYAVEPSAPREAGVTLGYRY